MTPIDTAAIYRRWNGSESATAVAGEAEKPETLKIDTAAIYAKWNVHYSAATAPAVERGEGA